VGGGDSPLAALAGVPRPHREELEDGIFHVYARGNAKQAIYLDDADRQAYLQILDLVVKKRRWRCLAYCLMENHVHLLLETPEANLAAGMQTLHGVYAQAFNQRHDRVGHLFQGRYGAVRIRTDAQLLTAARYLALNPVVAGLCAKAADWRWGSFAAAGSGAPSWLDHARLLELFSGSGPDPHRRYVEFVADE
jgi:REP-associated tyrosine transposase